MAMTENKFRFSLGELSPDLLYRTDTTIPNAGLKYAKNVTLTFSAGLTNIPKLVKTKSLAFPGITAMKIFKYKINKKNTELDGYLFLFTDSKLFVLRIDNFNKVGEVASSYTPEEINKLSIAQFDNSVIMCVENKEPTMIRVDEEKGTFTVVEYWKNIINPPVKRVESKFVYTEAEKNVFTWYKSKGNVIFESTLTKPVFDSGFLAGLKQGVISIFGGKFYIDKVENETGKQKITATQRVAPELDVPKSDAPIDDKKINILDITFSESLFKTGYPAVVGAHNGRIIFGNVGGNPSAIVASRVDDSLNFRQSIEDADGFTTFVSGNELNTVVDFISYKSLIAVTDRGIFSTKLNEGLTPENSQFYNQKLPRPKGLGKWTEADSGIIYVDSTDRIYQIKDVGSDSTYIAEELTLYSEHLIKNVNDLYYFKLGKNIMLGVDQESTEARVLTFKPNLEENIICWSRAEKIQGINEYVNIHDKISIFNITEEGIDIYNYSETEYEPIQFKLGKPTLSQKYNMDVPATIKNFKFGRVSVLLFGPYEVDINGNKKSESRSVSPTASFYEKEHIVTFPNVGKSEFVFNQLNNKRIEVIGVFTSITGIKGEDE